MDRKPGHLTKDYKDAHTSLIWVKIVGIGNASVGKTCLIKHFCESKFNPGYQPTVGVDYGFKIQEVYGIDLRVHLWDLSGSSEYLDVRNELYGATDGVFLVFDVTCEASFESLDSWLREVSKYATGSPEIVLVASKVDQKQKRVVSSSDARKWAAAHQLRYFEASASSGEGVDKIFLELLRSIMDRRRATVGELALSRASKSAASERTADRQRTVSRN